MKTEVLTFDYRPIGDNGRVNLTVRLGDETLAMDKLDILSLTARERFTKKLCKDRAGIDAADVEGELLAIAHDLERRQRPQANHSPAEVDVRRIVRPERFITPEVSALSVATAVAEGGQLGGRWRLYLRWSDGERETMDLPDSLSLPDGGKLWVHPTLGEPSVRQAPAWTGGARESWLAGKWPVEPAEVFKRLCQCIAHYVEFPKDRAAGTTAMLALWAMLTYGYPAWPATPYLYLGGPASSGKSRVFEVLSRLVFRPLVSSNMTAASMFRTLHERGGTLLYDEAERLKESTPDVNEIRSMLLAGYKRGGRATRLEAVNNTFRTVEFEVYGPKAMACIKGLPATLATRCIPVVMFRAGKDSSRPRRRIDGHVSRWEKLRADLHAMALDCGGQWLALSERADVCPTINGRQYELWQPLLALAAWIEDHGAKGLLKMMQGYALASAESAQEEETPDCDEVLLRVLAGLIREGAAPTAKDVLTRARSEEDRMFDSWSAKGAANALRRYGVRTHKTQGLRIYGHVTVEKLGEVQAAYNMDLGLPQASDQDTGAAPENVPHVPHVPSEKAQTAQDGAKRGT